MFRHFRTFIENEIQKSNLLKLMHVRIPFGSDYSCESFWLSLRALHTWIVQYLHIIEKCLSSWLLIIRRQPFSSLAIDFQADLSQNCNSANQEHCFL